jgi:hypothetical protein
MIRSSEGLELLNSHGAFSPTGCSTLTRRPDPFCRRPGGKATRTRCFPAFTVRTFHPLGTASRSSCLNRALIVSSRPLPGRFHQFRFPRDQMRPVKLVAAFTIRVPHKSFNPVDLARMMLQANILTASEVPAGFHVALTTPRETSMYCPASWPATAFRQPSSNAFHAKDSAASRSALNTFFWSIGSSPHSKVSS